MKKLIIGIILSVFSIGCEKTNETWENVKTAGRYLNQGIDSLLGKDEDPYIVTNEAEFIIPEEKEFIPLEEEDLKTQFKTTDMAMPQPPYSPGEKSSGVPGMEYFKNPSAQLSNIFQLIHFHTDDHVIRQREDLVAVQKIANFLKKNTEHYLVIEGHCDKRASAAYNMALGTKRANHVRVLLIKQGIDANRLYTVSHGKEKPLSLGDTPEDWQKNRRSQFKIYKK